MHAGLVVLCFAVAGFVLSARSDDPKKPIDWHAARQATLARSVASLESLVEWCNSNEVFAERDKLFEAILRIQPDNFRAHKGLKHVQARDGKWVPPSAPVVSRNFNLQAAEKFGEKLQSTLRPFCDELLALVDANQLVGADRDQIYGDVLLFDPDNARIHGERSELKLGDVWVLVETADAKKHRAELKELVRHAVASSPEPTHCELEDDDRHLEVNWTASVTTPKVRVLSTGPAEEAATLARQATATLELYRSLFDPKAADAPRFTIYVVSNGDEKKHFLEHHPAIDEKNRAAFLPMSSIGLTADGDFVTSAATAEQRLDTVVRQTLSHCFRTDLHLNPDRGWAFEGFGMYLTRELTGTRMTWYVLPQDAAPAQKDLRQRLTRKDCNWMNEAHEMLESARRPDLAQLLAKDVNQLSIEDLLYAYVLASYLLEARAEQAPILLKKLGEGKAVEAVLAEVLGSDLATLDSRVRRWLSERH